MEERTLKSVEAHHRTDVRYGESLFHGGAIEQPINYFTEAISYNPNDLCSHHNFGVAIRHAGHYEAALDSFKRVLVLNNTIVQTWIEGGNTLCCLSRYTEAVEWYHQALALSPESKEAHYNLANALKKIEHYSDALEHYRSAIEIDPCMPEAHNNLGTLLMRDNLLDQACVCFQKAIAHNQEYPQAYYNLGLLFESQGKVCESIVSVQKALKIAPAYGEALSLMVSLLQQACSWDALALARNRLQHVSNKQLHSGQRPSETPFLSFCLDADPQRNFVIARAWSRGVEKNKSIPSEKCGTLPITLQNRRITIGYLSEQFRNAATAHLTAGLFAQHDRKRFKIIAYSWGRNDSSCYRRKIMHDVDAFVDLRKISDADAVRKIYNDRVDILVDLMGWMKAHRMGILASKPAPIQVNYLGYPGTTGASFMDYILVDKIVVPPEEKHCYSEKVVYLPDCYQVTDPDPPVDNAPLKREDVGLPPNAFVFCSFSNDYKIEAHVFAGWMMILKSVPNSLLWLLVRSHDGRENLRRAAASQNVDPHRLIFAEPLAKDKHLARLRFANLALDTFTVNGHTTATDVLWAGVPLITCMGNHFASRVGASILNAAGLPELVVRNAGDYHQLAVDLATSPTRLETLKQKLLKQKTTKPLFNLQRFTRQLERAYETMWNRFIECRPPASFEVSRIE